MTQCVMDHAVPGRHDTDCAQPFLARVWDADVCRGCLLASAEVGALCQWHWRTLSRLLAEAGPQHAALLEDLAPSTSAGREPVSGSSAPGVPLALTPLDCATQLQRLLSEMVSALHALHPEDAPPARLLSMADRQSPDPVRAHFSPLVGAVIAVVPDEVYSPTTAAAWLRGRVGWLAHHPAIGDDLELLLELMTTAHRLAPLAQHRPQLVPWIPCPSCHQVALVRFPAEYLVDCASCSATMTDDAYRAWVREVQAA